MTTKLVNGVRVDLTPDEVAALQAEWAAAEANALPAARAAARARLIAWTDALTAPITSEYAMVEEKSWDKQEDAARRFMDEGEATPAHLLAMIDSLLVGDETRADRAAGIIAKADFFTAIAGFAARLRKETNGAIDQASTAEEVETVLAAALASGSTAAAAMGLAVPG